MGTASQASTRAASAHGGVARAASARLPGQRGLRSPENVTGPSALARQCRRVAAARFAKALRGRGARPQGSRCRPEAPGSGARCQGGPRLPLPERPRASRRGRERGRRPLSCPPPCLRARLSHAASARSGAARPSPARAAGTTRWLRFLSSVVLAQAGVVCLASHSEPWRKGPVYLFFS